MKTCTTIFCALILLLGVLFPALPAHAAAEPRAGAVTVDSGRVNVRSRPALTGAVLARVSKGSYITLLERSGDWWLVEYAAGQQGYCHKDYVTPVKGAATRVSVSSGRLNVRRGPGTAYERVAALSQGESVVVISTRSGWSRVLYHGTKTGYVSSRYLGEGSGYAAVALDVPGYKQFDSRWAQLTVGESGQTMKKIGCATTAVAMVESYRSGETITPAMMARRAEYTPSGAIYWPEDYTAVTDGGTLLEEVYAQLARGKCVLLGAKTSAGGQHWVVITGYTGGDSLKAENFTIHDPGSSYRHDLQAFFNAYPYLYKYFVY